MPSTAAAGATCATDASLVQATKSLTEDDWCTAKYMSDFNQVCALGMGLNYLTPGEDAPLYCVDAEAKKPYGDLPEGID